MKGDKNKFKAPTNVRACLKLCTILVLATILPLVALMSTVVKSKYSDVNMFDMRRLDENGNQVLNATGLYRAIKTDEFEDVAKGSIDEHKKELNENFE